MPSGSLQNRHFRGLDPQKGLKDAWGRKIPSRGARAHYAASAPPGAGAAAVAIVGAEHPGGLAAGHADGLTADADPVEAEAAGLVAAADTDVGRAGRNEDGTQVGHGGASAAGLRERAHGTGPGNGNGDDHSRDERGTHQQGRTNADSITGSLENGSPGRRRGSRAPPGGSARRARAASEWSFRNRRTLPRNASTERFHGGIVRAGRFHGGF